MGEYVMDELDKQGTIYAVRSVSPGDLAPASNPQGLFHLEDMMCTAHPSGWRLKFVDYNLSEFSEWLWV